MTAIKRIRIADGDAGIWQTLKCMKQVVKDGRRDPAVRLFAAKLVNDLPQKAYALEAARIHDFVRDKIRYVRDIYDVETLHGAKFILENGYGDCDDKTILACAMLGSIGHPTRMVAVGYNGGGFSHVFPQTKIGSKWVAMECTEPLRLGELPQRADMRITKRMVIYN